MASQQMATLPSEWTLRGTCTKPFEYCGVDVFGHYNVIITRGKTLSEQGCMQCACCRRN